jgi:hypothetical protein
MPLPRSYSNRTELNDPVMFAVSHEFPWLPLRLHNAGIDLGLKTFVVPSTRLRVPIVAPYM